MFALKLWGKFAAFRDPLTITQNITLPIPPKTTIGGIMAAILGIDYNDYFADDEYFNFKYSLILMNPTRKKSFAQNYIMDYTSRSQTKFKAMQDCFVSKDGPNTSKTYDKCITKFAEQFPKSKPIFRELLLDSEFLVFVKDYKYEEKIIYYLKNHESAYNLYMGNTEFAANYKYLDCENIKSSVINLDSFTTQSENIKFEPGKVYTSIYAATKVTKDREYREYKKIVLCNAKISLRREAFRNLVKTEFGEYACEFI